MSLYILTETSAGYALLKSKDKKLLKRDDLVEKTTSVEDTCNLLKLKHFSKFESATAALAEAAALTEGKVTPMLSELLDNLKEEKKANLAVADTKLANAINKLPQLQIVPLSGDSTLDLFRAIRTHLPSLLPDILPEEMSTMNLGLSHSLSRHKLKFSPDKVDTMIIQAIALLDDLDKELNTYAMRVKEWYGWHFPEMAKIINDNLAYARVILSMGVRSNAATTDLSDILPEEIEGAVKAAAEISMGTEITEEDLITVQALAEQVVGFTEYRAQLSSYLTSRMQAIAPNATALVGELVGARLIAHSGSLMNLAKSPASTIQILGAEKALFRALKTKHDTPKYGLIYHASLIGQATGKNKGKVARILATKTALGLRVDALSDWGAAGDGDAPEPSEEEKMAVGINGRLMVERRLRALEGKPLKREGVSIGPGGQTQTQPGKWSIKEARKYNADADGLAADEPAAAAPASQKKVNGKSKPLIEELEKADEEEEEDAEMVNGSGAAEAEVNGESDSEEGLSKEERKALKKAKKEAKAARKAEKEAKRAAKEAKRAAKEGTTNGVASGTALTNGDEKSKKRKHEEEAVTGTTEVNGEKKKKKKKSKD